MGVSTDLQITEQQRKPSNQILQENPEMVIENPETGVSKKEHKLEIVWLNVLVYVTFHCGAFFGFYLCFASAKWPTIFWGKLFYYFYVRYQLLIVITKLIFVFHFSCVLGVVQFFRNNWWSAQIVGSSFLQSKVASSPLRSFRTNTRSSGTTILLTFFHLDYFLKM